MIDGGLQNRSELKATVCTTLSVDCFTVIKRSVDEKPREVGRGYSTNGLRNIL